MKQMDIKSWSLIFVCATTDANGTTSCCQLPGLAYTKYPLSQRFSLWL